ncbi:MAG: hypothetical protein JRF61_14045 [Deltaproteobacteria bacterium]|nr:hypothetical protein [Deltaproteobacteria bacterium]
MSFDKWKDLAELVALVAVVGSLVLVVIELRQTQAALQAQTYQDRAFDSIAFNLALAELDIDLPRLVRDWRPGDLAPQELRNARRIMRAMMIDLDNEYFQYRHGFLDEDFYTNTTVRQLRRFAPIWRRLGMPEPREAFRGEVDRVLSAGTALEAAAPGEERNRAP